VHGETADEESTVVESRTVEEMASAWLFASGRRGEKRT
jgi:hypothetical protein